LKEVNKFYIAFQLWSMPAGRIGIEWNTSAPGLCWWW